jgi:hypothetical protein
VILTLHAAGTQLHGYQLLPTLAVAGAGAGLFLAPVTGVIIAGLPNRDAGSASGLLATAQQVGAALGIAIAGVIFFGLLGHNASYAQDKVIPTMQARLAAADVPAQVQAGIVQGFTQCFSDRAHAKDPASVPDSCLTIQRCAASAPEPLRGAVRSVVFDEGVPQARKYDFSRSLQQALRWQIGVFVVSFLLVLALPKVKPADISAVPGG